MASADVHEDLKCSICLVIYTNPVTLTCGHNYCRECIKKVLDTQEGNQDDYSCPQCRKTFRGRPELQKNIDLSYIAEKMKEIRKCPVHDRILEFYCTEDSTCICVLCRLDGDHQGHQTEKPEVASEKKKDILRNDLQKLMAEREEIDERICKLQNCRGTARKHIDDIKEKYTALIRDIRKRLEDLDQRVQTEISRQKEQRPISDLIQNLELKKNTLSKKISHIEELCAMTNPIPILEDRESDRHAEEDVDLRWNTTCEQDEFIIAMMLHTSLLDMVKMKDSPFPVPRPKRITLDINTAADDIQISDDRKTAKSTDVAQKRPKSANRFPTGMVLSTNKFSSGQHYWVVETSASGTWGVGMCYPSMSRSSGWIGGNNKSWGIMRFENSYQAWHNGKSEFVFNMIPCSRLGVYLDYKAGRLSFYVLSDSIRLLRTFTDTFTEPLHAVFHLKKYDPDGSHGEMKVF